MCSEKSRSSSPSKPARPTALIAGTLALFALWLPAMGASGPAHLPGMKLEVRDQTAANRLRESGATLISDYGSYQLFEVTNQAAAIARSTANVRRRPEYNLVRLNTGHLDTSKPENRGQSPLTAFPGKRLHLIHFAGPPKPEWLEEIRQSDIRIVSYLPQNAYLLYGNAAALGKLRSHATRAAHVQWEGPFRKEHKIQPGTINQSTRRTAGKGATDSFAIQLVQDGDANSATLALLNRISLAAPTRFSSLLGLLNIVVRLPVEAVSTIAEQPDVVSVRAYQPKSKTGERQAQISAGNLDGNLPAGPGYLAWLGSKGFTQAQFEASGFVVDVTDSGLDNGTVLPNHFGLYQGGELSNPSRVAYARLEGSPNNGSTLQGCDGHGTLNSHVVAGYDYRAGFPFTDNQGYNFGLGVCPFVKVGSSVIFDPTHFTYPVYSHMLSRAYDSGARVSNNSWGDDVGDGTYDFDAQEYDALVRDAQPDGSAFPAAGNQEMVIVFAAGNDGSSGSTTVGAPATAKNVICVGASENVQSIGGTDSSGVSDSAANSANDIAWFSSRGPCVDGRQKPDIVAPGTHVSGGVFQIAQPPLEGQADPCFTANGVSGGPSGSSFFPGNQQFFTTSSGTSHSAPAVAGGAALLRQWFINQGKAPPSPAMTKACLVAGTRYLTGTGANDDLWSPRQGMGLMDLGRMFDSVPRVILDQVPQHLFTGSGQSRTFTAVIQNPSEPLRISLAWTDAPGSTVGNSFNNDIDLAVTVNGTIYLGNVFSGAYSTPGGTADYKNNLESVFLPPGTSGQVLIQIVATSINSDGVPNNGQPLDQDFALVVYNGELVPSPSIVEAGSSLLTEDCQPENGLIDPGETVAMSFGLRNVGTLATTNLTATLLSTGGVVAVTTTQQYDALEAGGDPVSRSFSLVATGPCGGSATAHLLLQDGTNDLGIVRYDFRVGAATSITNWMENFDTNAAPDLPASWVGMVSGNGIAPVSSMTTAHTPPNAIYLGEPDLTGASELLSPPVLVQARQVFLRFSHYYDTEIDPFVSTLAYDGGVLEIKIGNGAFQDVIAAGGSFLANGYTRTIDSSDSSGEPNPLGNRSGWCGDSAGFVETIVDLPASTEGEIVQFRWRLGTDTGNYYGGYGWYIDSVYLVEEAYTCCVNTVLPPMNLDVMLSPTNIVVRVPSSPGYNYILEYSQDLETPVWTEVLPAQAGNGGKLLLEHPGAPEDRRFYRVRAFRP